MLESEKPATVDWRPDVAAILEKLHPTLEALENDRLEALARRGKARLSAGLVVAGFALAGLVLLGSDLAVAGLVLAAAGVFIAWLTHHLLHGGACEAWRHKYKEQVFSRAARAVAPGINYSPYAMVQQQDFQRSGLFNSRIDRYRGEDCFSGRSGSTDLIFSELHVEREEKSRDSDGKQTTRWVTVFKGIYLIADFHKHFRCQVSIVPDVAEATFGWMGRKFQGLSGDLVRMENPEFERAFKVQASDPVEVRYLLTPDMQERFLEFRNRWSMGVRAALIDSNLHLAIPNNENWFETDIRMPATDRFIPGRFIEQLVLLLHIPEQLDLNTRIWTKE